jgi:flagellar basal-body rod protein FlgG
MALKPRAARADPCQDVTMLYAIDLSRAAMLRQQQYLDVSGQNIANLNTNGFRLQLANLTTGENSAASSDPSQATTSGTPPLTAGVYVSHLFTQGTIAGTGNPLDLAINGEGFFAVQLPDGTQGYTRNGAFQVDDQGRLSDGAGNLLQPPITVPQGATNLHIGSDGNVSAEVNGAAQPLGQIQLAWFVNPNGLQDGANGILAPTATAGLPRFGAPGTGGFGSLRQGALEGANGDLPGQFASLMAAQRAYQMNTSAFSIADQMLHIASTLSSG